MSPVVYVDVLPRAPVALQKVGSDMSPHRVWGIRIRTKLERWLFVGPLLLLLSSSRRLFCWGARDTNVS